MVGSELVGRQLTDRGGADLFELHPGDGFERGLVDRTAGGLRPAFDVERDPTTEVGIPAAHHVGDVDRRWDGHDLVAGVVEHAGDALDPGDHARTERLPTPVVGGDADPKRAPFGVRRAVGQHLEERALVADGAADDELDGDAAPVALIERNGPAGGLESVQATRRGGDADRARAVRGVGGGDDAGGDRRRAAARRSADRERAVVRVPGDAEGQRLRGSVHHELGHGGAADDPGTRRSQPSVVGAGRRRPNPGGEPAPHLLEAVGFGRAVVLAEERHPGERPDLSAVRRLVVPLDDRVDVVVGSAVHLGRGRVDLGEGDFAGVDRSGDRRRVEFAVLLGRHGLGLAHRAVTRG